MQSMEVGRPTPTLTRPQGGMDQDRPANKRETSSVPGKVGRALCSDKDRNLSQEVTSTLQGTVGSVTPSKGYEMGTYSHPERQPRAEYGIA
jgi:hypothetical protein